MLCKLFTYHLSDIFSLCVIRDRLYCLCPNIETNHEARSVLGKQHPQSMRHWLFLPLCFNVTISSKISRYMKHSKHLFHTRSMKVFFFFFFFFFFFTAVVWLKYCRYGVKPKTFNHSSSSISSSPKSPTCAVFYDGVCFVTSSAFDEKYFKIMLVPFCNGWWHDI